MMIQKLALFISTAATLSVAAAPAGLTAPAAASVAESMPSRTLSADDVRGSGAFDPVAKALERARTVTPGHAATRAAMEATTLSGARTSVEVVLTALPLKDRLASMEHASQKPELLEVGRMREVPVTLQKSTSRAQWQAVSGGYVWRVSVRDPSSAGVRSRLAVPAALSGAQLRVAGSDGVSVTQAISTSLFEGEVWSGYTEGETQTIEIFSPTKPDPDVQPTLVGSVYFYESLSPARAASARAKQVSGSCNKDVQCGSGDPALDAAMAETKKAVTWLNFNVDGRSFICTGTLINSQVFPRAFIMTANHCIGRASTAASLTTFWFRETTACNSDQLDTGKQRQVAGGARFSFTNFNVDGTLLELNQSPPEGAVYAAWTNELLPTGTQTVSLSHPKGDPIKLALGPNVSLIRPNTFPQDMYGTQWTKGQTEGGSSGSGLFRLVNNALVFYGTLFGTSFSGAASSTCDKPSSTSYNVYGRFEVFQPQISEILKGGAVPADDAGNTIATARNVGIGTSVDATLGYAGDIDVFRVDVTEAGLLSLSVDAGTADLVSALLDRNGEGLDSNDDAQTNTLNPGLSYRVQPGTYNIAVAHFDALGQSAYKLSTRFDKVTANYNDIWWNPQEDGWGINIAHQGNTLFSALYTYERDGSPVWLVSAGQLQVDGSYRGPLLKATGPAFNAVPWNTAAVSNVQAGDMTIRFQGADQGTLVYTYQGSTVTKTISRFQYGTSKTRCEFTIFDRSSARNLQDIWWLPSESGWGMTLAQQDATMFAVIYTFDAAGKPLWLAAPAGTLTGTGANAAFVSDLYTSRGPAFDAVPWTPKTSTKVGIWTLKLTTSAKGTLTYTVNGATVTKAIERFTYGVPASECARQTE